MDEEILLSLFGLTTVRVSLIGLSLSEQPMLSGSSQLTFFLLSQHFSLWAWWLKLYLREWKKNLIKIEYLKHSSFSWKVSNTSFHILAMKKKDVSNIIVLLLFLLTLLSMWVETFTCHTFYAVHCLINVILHPMSPCVLKPWRCFITSIRVLF